MSAVNIEQRLYLKWWLLIADMRNKDVGYGQWFSIHYLKAEDSTTHKMWNATTLEAQRYIIQWLEDHCYTDTLPSKVSPDLEETRYEL